MKAGILPNWHGMSYAESKALEGAKMNKYLLLTAAAVFSTATETYALPQVPGATGHASVSFGPGYCNVFELYWSQSLYYANRDEFDACTGYTGVTTVGVGFKSRERGVGEIIQAPGNIGAFFGEPSIASDFIFSAPLRNGHSWIALGTYEGYSAFEFASGSYYVTGHGNGKQRNARNGRGIPVQQKLLEIARAHRGGASGANSK